MVSPEFCAKFGYHVSRIIPHLRFLLVTGLASVALVAMAYAPFWRGLETLSIERRQGLLTSSLPAAVWAMLQGPWGQQAASARISLVAAGMTALFALWQAIRAWRDGDWLSFPRSAFNILMFYLLLTCLWFQNWYAIWPLGVAALLPAGFELRLAVLFSFATLAKPLVFEPLWLWQRPMPPKAWRELRLGPAVMLLPWLFVLSAWLQPRLPRRAKADLASGSDL